MTEQTKQAIDNINNMEPVVKDSDFNPYVTDVIGDDVIASIETVLKSGGFQENDLVNKFTKDEISKEDFSKSVFDELSSQFKDNDIHTYRETRSHLVIENQADFIATQAALTGMKVIDFYEGYTDHEISLERVNPIIQDRGEDFAEQSQVEAQPADENADTDIDAEFFEEEFIPEPIEEQQPEQIEPESVEAQQPEVKIDESDEFFEEEIIPAEQSTGDEQLFEEEIIPEEQLVENEKLFEEELVTTLENNAGTIIEEEIIVPPEPKNDQEEVKQDDFVAVVEKFTDDQNGQGAGPTLNRKETEYGSLNGLEDDVDLNDFEIDNEVDSDIYDLSELKIHRVDTLRI